METLTALADPTRRRIVEMLAERERTAGEIVAEFSVSGAAISQHLKVLRDAGLVTVRADGQRRIQSLDFRGMKQLESWLACTRRAWERRLDALERELHAEAERGRKKRF